jgi:hypothetical protein
MERAVQPCPYIPPSCSMANTTEFFCNSHMQYNAPLFFKTLLAAAAVPLVTLVAAVLFFVLTSYIRAASSPLNVLRGPKSRSWIFGNLGAGAEIMRATEDWVAKYGHAIVIKAIFGVGL